MRRARYADLRALHRKGLHLQPFPDKLKSKDLRGGYTIELPTSFPRLVLCDVLRVQDLREPKWACRDEMLGDQGIVAHL